MLASRGLCEPGLACVQLGDLGFIGGDHTRLIGIDDAGNESADLGLNVL